MLIVACPKTASSSLLSTLSSVTKKRGIQKKKLRKKDNIPEQFKILSQLHSDLVEINKDNYSSSQNIFKQHFPPTKNNIEKISNPVILLGDPNDIILSYRRKYLKDGTHLWVIKKHFSDKMSDQQFLDKMKEIGLFQEIELFIHEWEQAKCDKLIVYKKDIIHNTIETVNKILSFWGYPPVKKVRLKKENLSF